MPKTFVFRLDFFVLSVYYFYSNNRLSKTALGFSCVLTTSIAPLISQINKNKANYAEIICHFCNNSLIGFVNSKINSDFKIDFLTVDDLWTGILPKDDPFPTIKMRKGELT